MILQVDVVAGKEPIDSGGSGRVVIAMDAEAVDIFSGGDEIAELIGFGFVDQGELDDDAVDVGVVVGALDFVSNVVGRSGTIICDDGADVFAVTFFEVDIFGDDGIIAVADDEEGGTLFKRADFASLTFFDEAGELGAI